MVVCGVEVCFRNTSMKLLSCSCWLKDIQTYSQHAGRYPAACWMSLSHYNWLTHLPLATHFWLHQFYSPFLQGSTADFRDHIVPQELGSGCKPLWAASSRSKPKLPTRPLISSVGFFKMYRNCLVQGNTLVWMQRSLTPLSVQNSLYLRW